MSKQEYRLAAILFAQVHGFDRIFEADEQAGLGVLDTLHELIPRLGQGHRGRIIRAVRDTWLIEYPTTLEAVRCAIEIQEALAASGPAPGGAPLALRIGIHLGDIHFLENDATGEGIAIASRLQEAAGPGAIYVSREVHQGVAGRIEARAVDRGVIGNSAGVEIRAYEIVGRGRTAEAGPPEDPDELKKLVLGQLKRVGRRVSAEKLKTMLPSRNEELDRAIDRLAELGFISKSAAEAKARPQVPAQYGHDEWRAVRQVFRDAFRRTSGYAAYRERVIERAHRARGGFAGHLIPFLMVNGFLFFLNFTTGFSFPWFLFPLGGWGIGLISHLVEVRTRQREKADVEILPETLGEDDFKLLRRFHKARSSFRGGVAALLSVSAFLLMINLVTSPGFPWSIFPIGGMMIGLASVVTTYLSRRNQFRGRLGELFKRGAAAPRMQTAGPSSGDSPLIEQAVRLSNSILEQAGGLDEARAWLGRDLKPLLEKYVDQIRALTARSREVEQIMTAIPRQELKRDLEGLRVKYRGAAAGPLREEYGRAIEQLERQNRSVEDLENQKELLDLHIANSLGMLKQMQIDLARMKSLPPAQDSPALGTFQDRTRELSDFLDDLREGYRELEQTPRLSEQDRRTADKLLEELKKKENRLSGE